MRDKQILKDLGEITILLQYLYMDENHKVIVKNNFDVPLELSMNNQLELGVKNLNFPNNPPMYCESQPFNLLGWIEQIKKEPAKEFPKSCKNRWEEIKTICLSNVALNFKK